jgi:hypothetical protein
VARARKCVAFPQSFLTAENQIGAVVFTYFYINYCEADKMSERRERGLFLVLFLKKNGWEQSVGGILIFSSEKTQNVEKFFN